MDHLLASVSAFMQNSANAQLPSKRDSIRDISTNVEHPGEVCDLRGGCAPLLGVGPRKMRIAGFPIDVYSVGMYAHPNQLKSHLKKHSSKGPCCLAKNSEFLQDIKNPDIEKELRIVTTFRRVTKDKFWAAFQTRLSPLLSKEQQNSELKAFSTHFDSIKFRKHTEVRLALAKGGAVTTIVDGEKVGSLQSPAISAALVDIYLGADPPSATMKADFLAATSRTLRS